MEKRQIKGKMVLIRKLSSISVVSHNLWLVTLSNPVLIWLTFDSHVINDE